MHLCKTIFLISTSLGVAVAQASSGTSCDVSKTGGDDNWRKAMLADISASDSPAHDLIEAMCNPAYTGNAYNCNQNGNTQKHCKYTLSTLSYNFTFEKWDDSEKYIQCSQIPRIITGFCQTLRPTGYQGSGYYRSSTENYNVVLDVNAPFISCSGDSNPGNYDITLAATVADSCDEFGGCQDEIDKPECHRVAIDTKNHLQLEMTAQNYGSGGLPNCHKVITEIDQRCLLKGKAGGWWGIGTDPSGSQEFYQLNLKTSEQPGLDFDDGLDGKGG